MKRTAAMRGWSEVGERRKEAAAMVSEAGCSEVGELVRMRNEEDGRHGLRGCSEVGELVRMRIGATAKEGRRGPRKAGPDAD